MDSEDKVLARVFDIQTISSSSQSTQEKSGYPCEASRSEDTIQEHLRSATKKELLRICFDKERKDIAMSKCKMGKKGRKNQELKRSVNGQLAVTHYQASRKQQRKGEITVRLPPHREASPVVEGLSTWICKNSACRATLNLDDTFCKRCSCCICHLFDDNKDPSLWLFCTSEYGDQDCCGLSCHLECAFQQKKAGVVELGQSMQLDGSYCCASCGKVSGALGCWKKQLLIAKDARRVDVLCYRISLSYRLLEGTSRFKELHEIVTDAKAKLETEVGAVNGVSAKMARGIVSRLSVGSDVQKLCSLAIEKADAWETTLMSAHPNHRADSLPAACKFQFEKVTSSSLEIVLKDILPSSSRDIKGYKLWYCKSRDETLTREPICVFPRSQRRISVSNLQPCTEYTFRVVSYTEAGDLGHSESKCFTKSVELIPKISDSRVGLNRKTENVDGSTLARRNPKLTEDVGSSGFKVRDLGKVLRIAWAKEECSFDGFCSADVEDCCGRNSSVRRTVKEDKPPSDLSEFDLNVTSVPDLNLEAPPIEYDRDEDIGCTSEQVVEVEDDVISHGREKNGRFGSNGSDDSQTWLVRAVKEVPAVESRSGLRRKRTSSTNEEVYDCDSTLIDGSPMRFSTGSGCLDETYEYCVKIIRWLECSGHIEPEFRMKFLTWYSLRSTEQERRVVNTFIQTLVDDPSSLAGQLVDSFLDIISSKRPRHGFCSKLWH